MPRRVPRELLGSTYTPRDVIETCCTMLVVGIIITTVVGKTGLREEQFLVLESYVREIVIAFNLRIESTTPTHLSLYQVTTGYEHLLCKICNASY